MIASLTALVIREIERRVIAPVVAEYRSLDAEAQCERQHADDPPAQLPSVVCATAERAPGWDHDRRSPAVAAQERFGFGPR